MVEGYVLHAYGAPRYVKQAVASVVSLRRHDKERPVALYAPAEHLELLRQNGLDTLFEVLDVLPPEHCSIVGFKHHVDRFMPFDRCLYVDADMIWCRSPDPLWRQLSAYSFTATGLERSDFWFGGPKGAGILLDFFLDRRRKTMRRFGLTYLPRVQAGMIYSADRDLAARVCRLAGSYLARRAETHFRSRLDEGRSEETCEWSLAMAFSSLDLPVFPWYQAQMSPQLDYVHGLVEHDPDFHSVRCVYYTRHSVYGLRGFPLPALRDFAIRVLERLPGRGDRMLVTPFVLHFAWLQHKKPYLEFAERCWEAETADSARRSRSHPVHDVAPGALAGEPA